jgi:hypothetical protein
MALTPVDFKPSPTDPVYFIQNVDVMTPQGQKGGHRNPVYCPTSYTGLVMKKILEQFNPKVVLYPACGPGYGWGWFDQVDGIPLVGVPWLDFGGGVLENAGVLANFWTHGQPVDFIEREVLAMIQQEIDSSGGE